MPIERATDKFTGSINTVTIGRDPSVSVGGQTGMPFLRDDGIMPHAPVVAMEIFDCEAQECPDALRRAFGSALADPVASAVRCVEEFGARALAVRLQSIHPDWLAAPAAKAVAVLESIRKRARVPLIIIGCGDDDRDNDVLPKVSQALKGENCLIGTATQTNYKTLAATCLADGHALIAESPIDINIAKQVNILISDMGFDPARIVMHPTTTGLGYGLEYVFSIMERSRLAAYIGDRMLAMPFIVFMGQETWKVKEAKESAEAQGVNWEAVSAIAMLHAGADIVVMRHPAAAGAVTRHIEGLMRTMRRHA